MPRFTDGETEARRDPGLESNSDLILVTFSFLFSFLKKFFPFYLFFWLCGIWDLSFLTRD